MAEPAVGTLAIVAGGGEFPALAIEACERAGRPYFVFALEGHADHPAVFAAPHEVIRIGAAGRFEKRAREEGVGDIVMVGRVRRPTLREIRPDAKAAAFVARVAMKSLGDDGLLRAVAGELESFGFRVVGIQDVVAGLLAPAGTLSRARPDGEAQRDIARGVEIARSLGNLDVGQAVVVQQSLVLGVEAIEGTDALLERCADLRRSGSGGVLVKIRKTRQDRRIDLPTVGAATVNKAAAAGLRGVAVEAGGTLLVNRDAVIAAADEAGLFLVGLALNGNEADAGPGA